MQPDTWINITLLLATGACTLLFLKRFMQTKVLVHLYFGAGIAILFLPYSLLIFGTDAGIDMFDWSRLAAIILYISGLLALIRESKPVFVRFPLYMTALPFLSFVFFPMMLDAQIIRDLLNAIYQGGALLVTSLILLLNFANTKGRSLYIAGLILAFSAYLSYWFYFNRFDLQNVWISEMIFAAALVITTFKFLSNEIIYTKKHE